MKPMVQKIRLKFQRHQGLRDGVYFFLKAAGFLLAPFYGLRIKKYMGSHATRKLQIGCGANRLEGWLNMDLKLGRGVVFLDAGRRLPFAGEGVDYIFSEHVIEHFEYSGGMKLLRECFRVLRPGGKIRIATPDLNFLIQLYGPNKSGLQERYKAWAVERFMPDIGIPEDAFVINHFFRAWGHRFIYDFKTLERALIRAGFAGVRLAEVGKSHDPVFANLESHGKQIGEEFNRLETLVAEAVKPHPQETPTGGPS